MGVCVKGEGGGTGGARPDWPSCMATADREESKQVSGGWSHSSPAARAAPARRAARHRGELLRATQDCF